MGQPSLKTIPLVKQLARGLDTIDKAAPYAGLPRGPQKAVIKDVDDPELRGRVRVLFDAFNKDIPEVLGAGVYSQERETSEEYWSHWIDVSPAFKGKQPRGLIGKRVVVMLPHSQYQFAVLSDVVYDPGSLTDSAAKDLEIPNNTTMTRVPVFGADEMPDPVKFNIGCMVIEEGGPMNSDWLCVCLKRDGKHIWVRHGDLAHGHAGANDTSSQVGASGARPGPGQAGASWDHVFITSHMEMQKYSAFGTAPRGNPGGGGAAWHSPPTGKDGEGNKIEPLPFAEPQLFSMDDALKFVREPGYPDAISGAFTTTHNPPIPAAVSSVPGLNFAQKAIRVGQKVLKVALEVKERIDDPTLLVQDAAKASQSFFPSATKFVLQTLNNPQATISTVYKDLKSALGL